ncbi:MAG: glycosyltransferase family 2 protein [Elusimicrobia bacterium]|nr:glycosyltransferase family 2 protein [Elusimicrobiota bacterium]MBU2615115.1 glycosyltransferase family 2 protein [Elusimicrobiota bacterium]
MKKTFSFFCPAYYDEKNITLVIEKAVNLLNEIAQDYEIFIINDGSPDNTGKVADELAVKYPKVHVIHHPKNLGYGAALQDGFKYANKFEYVLFTDGDNQYDVYDFKKSLQLLDQYDMVIGYREFNANSNLRKLVSICYNFFIRTLFGVNFKDLGTALRVVKRDAVNKIHITCTGPFAPAEIVLKLAKLGFNIGMVPIRSYPRLHGKSTSLIPKNAFETIKDILRIWWLIRTKQF